MSRAIPKALAPLLVRRQIIHPIDSVLRSGSQAILYGCETIPMVT